LSDGPEADHTRLVLIERQLADVQRTQQLQVQQTADLLEAWKSAKVLLTFIVFLAKVATAGAVLYATTKGLLSLAK
jgi:hypothetical protein